MIGKKTDVQVSVVIANYNGRHHLERCLPALAETRGVDFETIVVDNGSADGSVEFLASEYPSIRLVALKRNSGFGHANQCGVEAASGGIIAFLNNDTIVEPDWLQELLRCLKQGGRVGAVCSLLRFSDHPDIVNGCGGGMTWLGFGHCRGFGIPVDLYAPCAAADTAAECLYPTAAAMLIDRRVFEEMGGFDSRFFMYHEDVDLGWRLWMAGYRVLVCKRSLVYHSEGGTTKSERGRHWADSLGARHDIRSIIKNYELRNVFAALIAASGTWILNRRIMMTASAWFWNLLWLPDTLRERRAVQRHRELGDNWLFQAGLIERRRAFPVRPPNFPLRGISWVRGECFDSNLLLPAADSALGRLGFGWFPPEKVDGRQCRASWTVACAYLRVPAGLRGRLLIDLYSDSEQTVPVEIFCNGFRKRIEPPSRSWERWEMEAKSSDDGLLAVYISNSDETGPDIGSVRGCHVARICFESEEIEHPSYSSVDVIVPTCNRGEILMETLAALERQTRPPDRVVVVDDGSEDATADLIDAYRGSGQKPFEFIALNQPNSGPAAARNRGLLEARSDLLIFVGDDTIPADDFVELHLQTQNGIGSIAAVVGYTDWHSECGNDTPFLEYINRSGDQFGYGLMEDGGDVPFTCLYTSNVSLPRIALRDELFDEWFRSAGWEDVELGYRLSLRGMRIVYKRAIATSHKHAMSLRAFLDRQFRMGGIYAALIERRPFFLDHFRVRPCVFSKVLYYLMPLLGVAAGIVGFFDRRRLALPKFAYRLLLIWSYSAGMEAPVDYKHDPEN